MKLSKIVPLFLIFLSFFLTLVWFRKGLMYGLGEEQIPFYNPHYTSYSSNFIWSDKDSLGLPNTYWYSTKGFFKLYSIIYDYVGSGAVVQAFFFVSVFLSALLSTYLISLEAFKKNKNREKLSLVASLFYVFNLYTQAAVFRRFLTSTIGFFAVLPPVFYLYMKGLQTGKIRYSLLIVFFMYIFSVIYRFPGFLITLAIPLGLYFLIHIKTNGRKSILPAVYFSVFTGFVYFILNFWWIRFVSLSGETLISGESVLHYFFLSVDAVSKTSGLTNILRIYAPHYYVNEPAWGSFYRGVLFTIISFIPTVLVFWGIIKGWEKSKWVRYFSILFLISVFLAKGTAPPFGRIFYKVTFSLLPFIRMFRNPLEKFGMLLPFSFSILFAYGLGDLTTWLYKRTNKFVASMMLFMTVFLTIGVIPWPMWFGRAISYTLNEPAYVEVPDYYKSADAFFNSDSGEFRILFLPLAKHGMTYNWEYGYSGGDLIRDIFNKPVFARTIGTGDQEFFDSFNRSLDKEWFYNYLPLLAVKYVVVRDDIDYERELLPDPKVIKSLLDRRSDLTYVTEMGNLSVYKLTEEKQLPKIYAQNNLIITEDTSDMTVRLDKGERGVFVSQQTYDKISENFKDEPSEILPTASFVKINPIHYKVEIEKSESPFIVVFSEAYHKDWNAYVGGLKTEHFLVNGYSNGFLITQKGDFLIDLYFGQKSD